ncbi:hypothetical protein HNP29_003973 [Pseudomonas alcaligenes]|nr:hypothetical protein [Pseudomonas alcaligenes]
MRKILSIPFVSAVLVMSAGCTNPPMSTPDALTDYRPVSRFGGDAIPKEDENNVKKVCKLADSAVDLSSPEKSLERAMQKTYVRSCEYAFYSDKVKDFKAYTDQATLGFATVTAVGALTESHSDFVKSMAGLTGLAGGLRVYVNPNVQITTYIKAANATQCLGGVLMKVKRLTSNKDYLLKDLTEYEVTIEAVRGGLNSIKYNSDMQMSMVTLSPGPEVLSLLNQASDPDSDAESKKAALAFLKNIETLTDENLRTVYAKIVATLNAQAFNVESATQPIKAVHAGQGGQGGKDGDAVASTMRKSAAFTALAAGGGDNKYEFYTNLLKSLASSQVKDGDVPYAELIRLNGEFDQCMKVYAAN